MHNSSKRKSSSDIQNKSKRSKPNEPVVSTNAKSLESGGCLSVNNENNMKNKTVEDNDKKCFERLMNSDDCVLNDCVGDTVLDVYRTGAKCIPSGEQDSKLPGVKYHILGAVRTKPGRGAVSYTHLDVYKRQSLYHCIP